MNLYPNISGLLDSASFVSLPSSESSDGTYHSDMSTEKYLNMKIKTEIDINTLMSTIPEYDGYNMPFTKFRKLCTLAINTAPEEIASIVFSLIMQKLKGKAEKCVAHRYVESLEDLFDILSQNFESDNTISVLLSQLLQIKGDNCKELGNKIASIRDKLIIAVSNERINSPAALIEKFAMIKFIDNLPPEVNIITKAKNPLNLDKAIELATEEERYRRIHNASSFKARSNKPKFKGNHSYREEAKSNDNSLAKPSTSHVVCDYCKRPGHTRENCYRRKNNNTERGKSKVQYVSKDEEDYSSDSENETEDLNFSHEEAEEDPLRE